MIKKGCVLMVLVYFLLAFIATTLGAMAGLGGGVIIKPILDIYGHYDISTISILSSLTVLTMAVVSTINQMRLGFKIKKNMIVLTIGAILGGAFGKQLFSPFVISINSNQLRGRQAIILALLLIIVAFKDKLPKSSIKNIGVIFLLGVLLGTIATFLGIGGGLINVAILCIVLGFSTKDAAVISIFIILFSQASKLALIQLDSGFSNYDLSMLKFMIPGGIVGGYLGSRFNRVFDNRVINQIFNYILIGIILINVYIAFDAFFAILYSLEN